MTTLTSDPILSGRRDDFRRDGFTVLRRLLTGAALRAARRAATAAVEAPAGAVAACERPHNTLVPLRWDDPLVRLGAGAADRLAAAIGARDLRWISGYVSVKEPASPPLWWHQDWWAWDHPVSLRPEPAQIALLCYLSDTSTSTGALRVIPGTHRASVDLHAALPQAHSDDASALDPDHPAMAEHPGQVTLELRAGDAVVTDYRLLHGTHPNAGPNRRDCLLLSFTPDWSALPAEVRAHLIQHPALPADSEVPSDDVLGRLLPTFAGARADLVLNRDAPAAFVVPAPEGRHG